MVVLAAGKLQLYISCPKTALVQVLTAIELARQARIAANRAYLSGLQLGPQAMSSGAVRPLPVDDVAVLAAARELARKAARSEAKQQVNPANQCTRLSPTDTSACKLAWKAT